MPVPGSFSDISETPSSNSPPGSETVGTIMNQYIQQAYAFIKMLYDGKMVPTVAVTMNSQQLKNLANGTLATDAITVGQVSTGYLALSGGTISGALSTTGTTTGQTVQATSGLFIPGSGIAYAPQGLYVVWNEVGGTGATSFINNQGSGSGGFIFRNVNSTNTAETGRVTFSGAGDITSTGNITAYSDERFKENWKSLPKNFVKRLAEVKRGLFDRTDVRAKQIGVSAQSLRKVMPRAVVKDKKGILSVAYGQAGLVAAIEVASYAVAMEERIKMLEREIRALKRKVK